MDPVCLVLFFALFSAKVSLAKRKEDTRPNIVLIVTDDQDYTLGSFQALPKTTAIFAKDGVQFTNAFVTSPMCCPSRSSILTGQYAHNHGSPSNIAAECYSSAWRDGPERKTVGTYLRKSGYKTIYIGKYLNQYRGQEVPPGWDVWEVLASNSKYYNYTMVYKKMDRIEWKRYGDGEGDYFPDLMMKRAFHYLENGLRADPVKRQPLFILLSYPGPHGPEDSAPQYRDRFPGARAPRTPSFGVISQDKHWGVSSGLKLNETHKRYIDMLYRKRLQTLLSVDDHVNELYNRLSLMRALDSTYIFFFSDHGYHLGQWSFLKGKGYPYEDDVRVPFLAMGPRIPKGRNVTQIALNIDLAPTFLDIAGVRIPAEMDGMSLLNLFPQSNCKTQSQTKVKWRTSFLLERYKRARRLPSVLAVANNLNGGNSATDKGKEKACKKYDMLTSSDILPLSCLAQEKKYNDRKAVVKREYDHLLGNKPCLTSKQEMQCKKRTNGRKASKDNVCHQQKCPLMEDVNLGDYVTKDCQETLKCSPCNIKAKPCHMFGQDHWKTEPKWNESSFCLCYGSTNESYWCERRIENGSNYLYCVFSSTFEEYYDLDKDPYQLINLALVKNRLSSEKRKELWNRLERHSNCHGNQRCLEAGLPSQGKDVLVMC